MCNGDLTLAIDPPMRSIAPFDISDLECEALLKLFREATFHIQDIRIEMVTDGRRHPAQEAHPAATLGLAVQKPTIRFARSLDRGQRIDAIAHELVHILLVYRYGLRMIDRRTPRLISNQDIFDYFLNLNRHWKYFLEQIVNTIHHQILIDYLKGQYGIESDLQLALFLHNFRVVSKRHYPDKESQYAKGLVAFEYEKRMGRIEQALNLNRQSDFFWKAYLSAQKSFGAYDIRRIPSAAAYEEDVLTFLEDLGYQRRDFIFLPLRGIDTPSTEKGLKENV